MMILQLFFTLIICRPGYIIVSRLYSPWFTSVALYCYHDTIVTYYWRRCTFMYIILNSYWNTVNSSRDVFTSNRLFSSMRFLFSLAEHDPMTILDNVVDYAKTHTHKQTRQNANCITITIDMYCYYIIRGNIQRIILSVFERIFFEICIGRHSKFTSGNTYNDRIRYLRYYFIMIYDYYVVIIKMHGLRNKISKYKCVVL